MAQIDTRTGQAISEGVIAPGCFLLNGAGCCFLEPFRPNIAQNAAMVKFADKPVPRVKADLAAGDYNAVGMGAQQYSGLIGVFLEVSLNFLTQISKG